jgi:major type 1 subunit fimbrin (pilin)
MKQAIFKACALTAIIIGSVTGAQAATQPMVTITGDVTAVSCNVNASVPQNQINLGNFTDADFAAGTGIYTNLYTVANSMQTFSVGVNGCSGTAGAAGGTVSLMVTGTTIGGQTAVYNGGVGSTVGTAGASLAAPATIGGAVALVNNNSLVPVKAIAAAGDAADANGGSVTFTTYMASATSTPAVQHIVAPINFSVAYN